MSTQKLRFLYEGKTLKTPKLKKQVKFSFIFWTKISVQSGSLVNCKLLEIFRLETQTTTRGHPSQTNLKLTLIKQKIQN